MQSAKLINELSQIAGGFWSLAGELAQSAQDNSPQTRTRRTMQWRTLALRVAELDAELCRDAGAPKTLDAPAAAPEKGN